MEKKTENTDSPDYQSIKRTFDKVGQNPWSEDTEAFEKHLEALPCNGPPRESGWRLLLPAVEVIEREQSNSGPRSPPHVGAG